MVLSKALEVFWQSVELAGPEAWPGGTSGQVTRQTGPVRPQGSRELAPCKALRAGVRGEGAGWGFLFVEPGLPSRVPGCVHP